MDTIFAQASAQGRAGVSVIRISGPRALDVCRTLCGDVPPARTASLRTLCGPDEHSIDEAVVLTFHAPASFTGEDVVELHCHGSLAVLKRLFEVIGEQSDVRLALPGEFSRRALDNGKLDLTQIEGLGALIDSETEAQRRQAERVFSGELGAKVDEWRQLLIRAGALIEATIDFVDEEVPVDVTPEVRDILLTVEGKLKEQYQGFSAAETIRVGFEVAIVGPPNAGKSTLLNRIAGRDAAITSQVAGTTRDIIEVRLDIQGLPVVLLDTAGIRESTDEIERLGVKMAQTRAEGADLRVFLIDAGSNPVLPVQPGDLVVGSKADLGGSAEFSVSGLTGEGVDALLDKISTRLKEKTQGAGLITHERHREAIGNAISAIERASSALDGGPEIYDICAEEIRSVVHGLECLIGRVGVEDYLSEIFSSFCIGK